MRAFGKGHNGGLATMGTLSSVDSMLVYSQTASADVLTKGTPLQRFGVRKKSSYLLSQITGESEPQVHVEINYTGKYLSLSCHQMRNITTETCLIVVTITHP
ncbi:hypothetical protein JTE90_024361 [Oedothorax gibbosus]|uniref:Uncharacterized protein n=1 Tax=Oedothorax gibbosus TaxID=931172 RepID=A0AAV6VXP0_9ARAC|nr:hypothetical protein JTE90_024361 [Oedothorax gibbosus]